MTKKSPAYDIDQVINWCYTAEPQEFPRLASLRISAVDVYIKGKKSSLKIIHRTTKFQVTDLRNHRLNATVTFDFTDIQKIN